MKSIKIIAGSYGYRPAGSKHVKLINKRSGVIQVEAAEAERLVNLGVAVIVETNVKIDNPAGAGTGAFEKPEYSIKNKKDELAELMELYELEYSDEDTKQQMVDKLDAYFDQAEEDAKDAPALGASGVVE